MAQEREEAYIHALNELRQKLNQVAAGGARQR